MKKQKLSNSNQVDKTPVRHAGHPSCTYILSLQVGGESCRKYQWPVLDCSISIGFTDSWIHHIIGQNKRTRDPGPQSPNSTFGRCKAGGGRFGGVNISVRGVISQWGGWHICGWRLRKAGVGDLPCLDRDGEGWWQARWPKVSLIQPEPPRAPTRKTLRLCQRQRSNKTKANGHACTRTRNFFVREWFGFLGRARPLTPS